MADKLDGMTDDELAELRAKYDAQMQALRAKKADIQKEVDRRLAEKPLPPADHLIGG